MTCARADRAGGGLALQLRSYSVNATELRRLFDSVSGIIYPVRASGSGDYRAAAARASAIPPISS